MIIINECPICGSAPVFTIKSKINLRDGGSIIFKKAVEGYGKKLGQAEDEPLEILSCCQKCKSIYRGKFFDSDEIAKIFNGLYYSMEEEIASQADFVYNNQHYIDECSRKMFEIVKTIEKDNNFKINNIFDIGGRDGFRLKDLAINGYKCNVFDPIPCKPCHSSIDKEYIWSSKISKGKKADLVILCDVLEHCINPRQVIMDCAEHLRDGGFLFIEIPFDLESCFKWLLFGRLRKKSLSIDYTHNIFYSLKTITYLLESCGISCNQRRFTELPVFKSTLIEIVGRKCPDFRPSSLKGISCDFDLIGSRFIPKLFATAVRKLRRIIPYK